MKGCEAEGCNRPHHAHGLCNGHATQFYRGQFVRPFMVRRVGRRPRQPCIFPGCIKLDSGTGGHYCGGHRNQITRRRPLTPLHYKHFWNEAQLATIAAWRADDRTWAWIGRQYGISGNAARKATAPKAPPVRKQRSQPKVPQVFLLDRERRTGERWERCGCGLLLPCNSCLPSSAAEWARNRGDGGDASIVLRSKAA